MPRLGDFSGREVARVAEQLGWERQRMRGDHMIYRKPGVPQNLSVPDHSSLPPGTLRSLIRRLGLTVADFHSLAR